MKNKISSSPDRVDYLLKKSDNNDKLSGIEKQSLRNYLRSSVDGAGNSKLHPEVSERINKIRKTLGFLTTTETNYAQGNIVEENEEPPSIKTKLANLETYMPGQDETTYKFGRFLSERIEDDLLPMGFPMLVMLALEDLKAGKNQMTDEPISSSLTGQPPQIYNVLSKLIAPLIAKAIFSDEEFEGMKNMM